MAEVAHRNKRQVRRTVWTLTIVVLCLYFGFILYSVLLHPPH